MAVSCFGHGMPFVHLAKLSEDIGIESKRSSWLYFIIGFSSTASRLLVAKFGKNGPLSLPIICLLGNILLALGNLILPSTSVFYALVLYSIGYGVGEGLLITPALNIVLESIPNEKRGSGYDLFTFNCIGLIRYCMKLRSSYLRTPCLACPSASWYQGGSRIFLREGCGALSRGCTPKNSLP
ncbi:uncharacterized protein LOC114576518 [Exaiptasia diaphana]|uniref:Uncharacterized protein n=1 Tax=Exaiptasia diaphana TaxID=2652724 RepID=A0A913YUA8_EXADI|nr:uncharacterized protein LOC114576518 [Exaiptasia diaphana]